MSARSVHGPTGEPAGWWSATLTTTRFIRSVVRWISTVLSWISGLLVLVLMFLVVLEVILRDLFETTLGGTIEISEVLLVFLVFIGMSYTQHVGGHVATDLLTARVPVKVARVFRFVGLMVAVVVLLWAAQATMVRGWDSMQTGEIRFGIREVPIWPARLIIPVGFFLTALETLFAASDTLRRDWRPTTAGGDAETHAVSAPEAATS